MPFNMHLNRQLLCLPSPPLRMNQRFPSPPLPSPPPPPPALLLLRTQNELSLHVIEPCSVVTFLISVQHWQQRFSIELQSHFFIRWTFNIITRSVMPRAMSGDCNYTLINSKFYEN